MYFGYITSTLFFLIRSYAYIKSTYDMISDNLHLMYSKFYRAISTQYYVFFQHVTSPYNVLDVNISASSCALPLWYYIPEKKAFISYTVNTSVKDILNDDSRASPLPILSMQVTENDKVVFDLTDFLSTITVYSSTSNKCPSVAHLLGAWTLSARIVLDRERDFIIRILDENAKEYTADVCECNDIFTDNHCIEGDNSPSAEPAHVDSSEQEDMFHS